MATNLHIDEKLLAKAVKAAGGKTKRETVNEALAEPKTTRSALPERKAAPSFGGAAFASFHCFFKTWSAAAKKRPRSVRRGGAWHMVGQESFINEPGF